MIYRCRRNQYSATSFIEAACPWVVTLCGNMKGSLPMLQGEMQGGVHQLPAYAHTSHGSVNGKQTYLADIVFHLQSDHALYNAVFPIGKNIIGNRAVKGIVHPHPVQTLKLSFGKIPVHPVP